MTWWPGGRPAAATADRFDVRGDVGVGGEEELPAGVQRVVVGGDDGAVGKCATDVEPVDLAPAESVAEGSFGDGPVAVVASDRDRSVGRWREWGQRAVGLW